MRVRGDRGGGDIKGVAEAPEGNFVLKWARL
jgi:hypothetical protein